MGAPERVAVEPVQPLTSFVAHVHRSHLPQHPQMLRHLRLGKTEQVHELVHGALTAGPNATLGMSVPITIPRPRIWSQTLAIT